MANLKQIILTLAPLLLLIVVGCKSLQRQIDDLPFPDDHYDLDNSAFNADEEKKALFSRNEPTLEIKFSNASIDDLCDFFRVKTNYCLISNLSEISISGFFSGAPGKIINDIALMYNVNVSRVANTYYLYQGDQANITVTVALNCSISDDNLSKLFDGKYLRQGNKIIFNGSLSDALKLQEIVDSVNAVMVNNYVVTVVQVETSSELSYNLAVEIGSKGIDLLTPGVTAWDVFSAVARANGELLDFDSYHERQFYVTDGQKMTYNQTTDKKVEKRAITDQGTSTVSGYEDIQAGAIVDLTLQGLISDYVDCTYNIELSNFVLDTIDKRVTSVTSDNVKMRLGRIYYLASSQDKAGSKSFNFLGLGSSNENMVTSIYVKIDKIREN